MDETEVQVEIACWAQDHPEASTINWDNGNEPWVDFSGQRCTLHLGLGGLTWSIEVPIGYQTQIDAGDGKRKRLWDPLDYRDTVIVQSRNTPFRVSVVDHSNNTTELFHILGQGFANNAVLAGSRDGIQIQNLDDKLKALHLESFPPSVAASKRGKALRIKSNAYFETLKRAETLAEVLDVIHGLAKLYNTHLSSLIAPVENHDNDNTEGAFLEEEDDDEHLFDSDFTMKWSSIAAQANHAREACISARCVPPFLVTSPSCNSPGTSAAMFQLKYLNLGSPPEGPPRAACDTLFDLENLSTVSPPKYTLVNLESLRLETPPPASPSSSSSESDDDEYTILLPDSASIEEDLKAQQVKKNDDTAPSGLNALQTDTFSYDSDDSDKSDGSWELAGFSNSKLTSSPEAESGPESGAESSAERGAENGAESGVLEREDSVLPELSSLRLDAALSPEPEVLCPWDQETTKKGRAKSRESPERNSLPSKRMKVELQSTTWYRQELQWCDIAFNPVSFSIECTLRLSKFMNNSTIATALGFSLDHPLRLEIVPNKAQVDALAWTGAVEVYVSQHSDWHNHISEEICGLLCLVPDIVQTYLYENVPNAIRYHGDDLFVGLLLQIVKRLISVNAGGSCCVCGKTCDRPNSYHFQTKSLYPCGDNMCRARYATWEEVSSVDSHEREREENAQLQEMEKTLRETFSYADQTDLKSALEVYGINAGDMNYGQMIRALARIELWNQKDPDSSALEYPIFEVGRF
ncbi:unnamed protein product [Calypogeia fissa]